MRHVLPGGAGLGHAVQLGHHGFDGALDAALEVHRVHATGQVAQPFMDHARRQHGGGGGAIARHFAGACGHLAQQMRAHVLERVFQFHRPRHQHARVDDLRRPELAVQDHGAPARPHGHLHRFGQCVRPAADLVAGGIVEQQGAGFHRADS